MTILIVLERLIPLFFMFVFITQVLLPVFRDQKIFPIFRKKDGLDRQLEEAEREKAHAEKLLKLAQAKEEALKLESQADRIRFQEIA